MKEKEISKRIFRFKHFEMRNSLSGLKIGTDGVLLGAWADVTDAGTVWDVGSGTGLIALMLAQRCNSLITAIEIDPVSASECEMNLLNSPWRDRLSFVNDDVFAIAHNLDAPDLIVCNPPFFDFSASVAATGLSRDRARRSVESLSAESLISLAAEVLSPSGALCFIMPCDRNSDVEYFTALKRLHVRQTVDVVTRAGKSPMRRLWRLERVSGSCDRTVLSIRNADGSYTDEYRLLTGDYYLNF